MRLKGTNKVGRFSIEFEVANFGDIEMARRGLLKRTQVRRQKIQGVVDCGEARFALPQAVAEQLGLRITGKIRVKYADGRRAIRPAAQAVYVKILGRDSTFTAVIEPKRDTALIGAIVLEDLDLLVDSTHQRVIPRHPHGAIYEIE